MQARGLFHGLILESGACTGPWIGPDPSVAGSYSASATFAAGVNCTGDAKQRLACLRKLPAMVRSPNSLPQRTFTERPAPWEPKVVCS